MACQNNHILVKSLQKLNKETSVMLDNVYMDDVVFIYNQWVWFQFHNEVFSSLCMSQLDEHFSTVVTSF